jgi:hypothetical protein
MSRFRIVYPGSGKLLYDGGMNSKYEKSIIEDNESPDCLNVTFGAGSVGSREGFVTVNTASVGTFACDGLYTRKGTNNAETMVAFFGGTGFTLDNTSLVTIPSAQSIFTMGVRVGSAQMENHAFFGNGNVTPYKYNGTAFTRHGVPQATMTVSANSNGAGVLTGDYQYKVTYVNSQSVEGDVSSALTTFAVAAKQIRLTSLPVAPQSFGVSARRIYRTVAGGTSFLRVTTVNDNTTTLYDDNTADGSLGLAAPTNKGEPPKYSCIVYHQNRLFMNDSDNPGLLWWTDLNEPYTVNLTTNFAAIGDQSSDLITGLAVFNNTLAVFCQKAVWLVYMADTDPANWRYIRAKAPYSSKSPYGLFEYDNKMGYPAVQTDKFVGVAGMSGDAPDTDVATLSIATAGSTLKSSRVEPDMFDIQEAYLGNISSIVFKNVAYISMTKGANQTTNNRIYIMDFSKTDLSKKQRESWAPWTGLNAAQFAVFNGVLYFGSSTQTGKLWKQNSGVSTDDGSAINSYFWTKEFAGGKAEESFEKDFRWTNLLVDLAGAYFMSVGVRTDSDSGTGDNYNLDLDPNASLWGTMTWGIDTWGAGATQKDMRLYLAGARGKRIQYRFSNQNIAGQRFKVHWQNFTYNIKGPR